MPTASLVVAILLLLFGVAGLIVVTFFWHWVKTFYPEFWTKLPLELVQVFSGLVALYAGFSAGVDKNDWWPSCVCALIATGFFKIAQVVGDVRAKLSISAITGELARANREGERRTRLLSIFQIAVQSKRQRTQKVVAKRIIAQEKFTPYHARVALRPKKQLDSILRDLAVFFYDQLAPEERKLRNFRVGLYVATDGKVSPLHGISHKDQNYSPFKSHHDHDAFFRLDCFQG